MNKILSPDFKTTQVDIVLLILRVGVAVLMLTHGIPKLQMLLGEVPVQFPGIMGLSPVFSLFLTVFAEVICSILILFGLGTRLASVPLIITMLVAVFMIHLNDPFASKELGLLYIFLYLPLLVLGSGKFSLDFLMGSLQNKAFVKR
ncbi:DoxX family protein [Antarcticibacterium arcticum]|uniref:DoxX family protein n=1 Tax=Antarcticibacterium arcticum TaxID=2585771 RepID=A0A5B8YM50_9FLAO|nr:DoxX family protein [Antarcticibacterium arcticum]QED37703.1 DoxX family protein [Antarcticibacterium arcticum]